MMTPETPLFTVGTPDGSWLDTANGVIAGVSGAELQSKVLVDWLRRSLSEAIRGDTPAAKPLATALLAQLDVPTGPWGAVDVDACWVLDTLAARFVQARYLIFVASPAQALAAWLSKADGPDDADAILRNWHAGAAKLLRHAQRYHERCMLVDAAEARAFPVALAALCTRRFGLQFVPPATTDLGTPAVLPQAIGLALAQGDDRTRALHIELQASCAPLGNAIATAHRLDSAAVTSVWRRLCKEQERLKMKNEALRAEADALERTLAQQALAHQDEQAELLLQLHQVQGDLEHYYPAWQALQEKASAVATAALAVQHAARVDSVVLGREEDAPPHRHLDILLHGAHVGELSMGTVQARLVEHHGRPGLALFEAPGEPTPLAAWQPSGSEDGRTYVLLVPHDARERLDGLGCSDWALLRQFVAAIGIALQADESKTMRRWRVVVARLNAELNELPARLRYDKIEVNSASNGIDARLSPISFGSRSGSGLRLRWWPSAGHGGELELVHDLVDEPPLLLQWPTDSDGDLAPSWRLSFDTPSRIKHDHAWLSLTGEDRALVLALLDALPAVAERAAAQLGAAVGDPGTLHLTAALPLRAAQRALHGSRARRVWRALRGRVV